MVITVERVMCAYCGMVYDKPLAEQVFWIGVPFRVEGALFCPRCGSNASDPVYGGSTFVVKDNTLFPTGSVGSYWSGT